MKKVSLIFTLLCVCMIYCQAQDDNPVNNFSLGLNGWFNRNVEKYDLGHRDFSTTTISLQLEPAYWLSPQWQAGIDLGVDKRIDKNSPFNHNGELKFFDVNTTRFSTGLFLKHYFNLRPITPFISLRAGYSHEMNKRHYETDLLDIKSKRNGFSLNIPIGAMHMLSPRFGLTATWEGLYYKYDKTEGYHQHTVKYGLSGLKLNDDVKLGVIMFLRPRNKGGKNM